MGTHILKNFNLINTRSNVVGPILNSFAECLNENNITYKSVLEYENFSFLEINEQRIIFNSLLNISIISCLNSKEKEKLVLLKSFQHGDCIFIQIIFSKCDFFNIEEINSEYVFLSSIIKKCGGQISYKKRV